MALFAGPLTDVKDSSVLELLEDEPSIGGTITAPAALPEQLQHAYRELQNAQSHLLRGNFRAAIQFAADAVNDIAIATDNHGYASY